MSKLNKPRADATPDPEVARAFLAEQQIDPSEVTEAIHFSDGSMSVMLQRGSSQWHLGIEFDPSLTAQIAFALRSVGIAVERADG